MNINAHLKQFVNLVNSEYPKVFTNYENAVGDRSTGYYKSDAKVEIIDKISKFENGKLDNHLYLLFTYDEEKDEYDVIQKRLVNDLTEKFGYGYDTSVMDSKNIGDYIDKDEVLYKTTSYDEDNNYCYGKNVKIMYALDNSTIEDAILVGESFAKSMISKEVETIRSSINENDILINYYGNSEVYKCFPDVGETIKEKILCVRRRIHNNQVLYDLKKSNLRKININNDTIIFADKGCKIVDIDIYSNKTLDEIPDNTFNHQIREYLKMQNLFYQKVYSRCKEIIKSGSNYTPDIAFYYKKAKDILDPNVKYKEENGSVFSNMVIEFVTERDVALTIGQKIKILV